MAVKIERDRIVSLWEKTAAQMSALREISAELKRAAGEDGLTGLEADLRGDLSGARNQIERALNSLHFGLTFFEQAVDMSCRLDEAKAKQAA